MSTFAQLVSDLQPSTVIDTGKDVVKFAPTQMCDMLRITASDSWLIAILLPKVKQNGYIWFEGANDPEAQPALREIEKLCKLHTEGGTYRIYVKGEPRT